MNTLPLKLPFFAGFLLACTCALHAQSVLVGSQASSPHASAVLELRSTEKGLLVPRLTTAQRQGMVQPAQGLLIFNSETIKFEVNVGTPQVPDWQPLISLDMLNATAAWRPGGNQVTEPAGILGTQNEKSLSIITSNVSRIFIEAATGKIGIGTQTPAATLHVQGTDAIILPSGTTAQRPVAPVPGMIRFNNETGKLEGYTHQGWVPLN